jgi:aminopeptidase 2
MLTYDYQYDDLLKEFRNGSTSDDRLDALRALGRAGDKDLIQKTLTLALSEEVKSQDIYIPLQNIRYTKEGILAQWTWMTDNWELLGKKFPPGLSMLGSIVSICVAGYTHNEHIKTVEAFFDGKSTKGFDKYLAQSLDSLKSRSAWLERDAADVKTWLKQEGYLK